MKSIIVTRANGHKSARILGAWASYEAGKGYKWTATAVINRAHEVEVTGYSKSRSARPAVWLQVR